MEYNSRMAEQMQWTDRDPFKYHPDRGLYYHFITDDLICGTQPRTPDEVQELVKREGVQVILNLQQDQDFQYWGVDFGANAAKASELGARIVRVPVRDFAGDSLRRHLPEAVHHIARSLRDKQRVYVHCTAGLGRAPAACIAYLYWFSPQDLTLDAAYNHLTSIRPCGPRRESIRGATFDVLRPGNPAALDWLPQHAFDNLSADERRHIRGAVLGQH